LNSGSSRPITHSLVSIGNPNFLLLDDLVRSLFFTRSHKATKKVTLKLFKFFFVISVIFV